MRIFVLIILSVISFFIVAPAAAEAGASPEVCPSQVLFLYNKDWKGNRHFVDSGWESREVAEHYVRMRTDPVSGEKPYMFGLTCRKGMGSYLNSDHLEENSSDNSCGVVYQSPGMKRPLSACEMRDSRLVEVVLPDTGKPWNMQTLKLELLPESGSGQSGISLVKNGQSLYPGQVQVQKDGDWNIRAVGRDHVQGRFTARAACLDSEGQAHEWTADYRDIEHASFSSTGPDMVRDDQRYLDCVEDPIKEFLENPANARPDGTLLKDHILYFVVGFGLPRTVLSPYGIASGITENIRDHGSYIDFGQRLQLMYYDFDGLHNNQVFPHRFISGSSDSSVFTDYFFRTMLSRPLWGSQVNPFVHPGLYEKNKDKTAAGTLRFTSEQRAENPARHLFFATRIDAVTAEEARELVDRSVYASMFAGPDMGVLTDIDLHEDSERTGKIDSGSPAGLFRDLGYRHMFNHDRGWVRLELLRLAPDTGFFNTRDVFLPGGIATYVHSSQGWNRRESKFHEYLNKGVTVTAGAARVSPRLTPHIHNRSFWDEEVFYPYLAKGWPLGEVLLMNQIHVNWITSFVGDPLHRLPADPQKPSAMPDMTWKDNVGVKSVRDNKDGNGYLVRADLKTSAEQPRLAQMRLSRADGVNQEKKFYIFDRFSSRPSVFIPASQVRDSGHWIMELIDPFGNTSRLEGRLE